MGYINAAALHCQSVLLNRSDLTISALPGPPVACCTVQTVVNQIAQVPECPPQLRNPGFDSPLQCWAGRLRNLPVPVCSGLDLLLPAACPPARPRAKHCAVLCTSRLPLRKPCALVKRNPLSRASSPSPPPPLALAPPSLALSLCCASCPMLLRAPYPPCLASPARVELHLESGRPGLLQLQPSCLATRRAESCASL